MLSDKFEIITLMLYNTDHYKNRNRFELLAKKSTGPFMDQHKLNLYYFDPVKAISRLNLKLRIIVTSNCFCRCLLTL